MIFLVALMDFIYSYFCTDIWQKYFNKHSSINYVTCYETSFTYSNFFILKPHLQIQNKHDFPCCVIGFYLFCTDIRKNYLEKHSSTIMSLVIKPLLHTVKRLIFGRDLNWLIWLKPKNRQIK